jgi:hypothetical protein
MRERISILVARNLVSFIMGSVAILMSAPITSAMDQAVWVWPDPKTGSPITDAGGPEALVANASQSGVTELFVSVYSSTTSSTGRQMFADSVLNDLVQKAHTSKPSIEVWAAYGAPDWTTANECDDNSFPLQRVADVLNYNQANPSAKLDGIVLDVEPAETPPGAGLSRIDMVRLMFLYGCIIRKAKPLPVAAAISAFWTAYLGFQPHRAKPFYDWVIDESLKYVVVMGYRNTVGTIDCASTGIACLDAPAINYWINCPSMGSKGCPNGRSGNILAGLETSSSQPANVTFFAQGQTAMNQAARAVELAFPNGGLGGFAIDAYQNAYLGGVSSNWPSTNPNFPNPSLLKKHSKSKPKTPMK